MIQALYAKAWLDRASRFWGKASRFSLKQTALCPLPDDYTIKSSEMQEFQICTVCHFYWSTIIR